MNKKQGWFMYENIGFIPPDHMKRIIYTCSNCKYRGAYLIQDTKSVDDDYVCSKCGHAVYPVENP